MKPLVIFGAGDIAEVAHFYFTRDAKAQVAAFTVDSAYLKQPSFCGMPVVAFEELARAFPPAAHDLFVAVSYAKLNAVRAEKCAAAKALGYKLRSYVSSKATVWESFEPGENCLILEDNTLQPFVRIGANVTLWSGNHIGHHARIDENCFITSHAVISGGVQVGANAFIGVNATIRDHVKIGARAVIGAGSLVLQDVPDDGVVAAAGTELSKVPSHRLRRL
ncbi:MAG: acetyltransferase [Betaproteobacteria bacterium]|nr:acetyltransferase [Betaproteobacteria bacterium]